MNQASQLRLANYLATIMASVFWLSWSSIGSTQEEKTNDAAAQFAALQKEGDRQIGKLRVQLEADVETAPDEAARDAAQIDMERKLSAMQIEFAGRALDLVRPVADQTQAVDWLLWIVANARSNKVGDEAVSLLRNHHLLSPKTIMFATRARSAAMRWTEPLLRELISNDGLKEKERAQLTYALACMLQNKMELPSELESLASKELAIWQSTFDEARIAELRSIDVAKAETEAIECFELLIQRWDELKMAPTITYGAIGRSSIFSIRNLTIGKRIPDLSGQDIDGEAFKLSDYRGKVVLLSYWGTWCNPCMRLIPHERELVEKFRDAPFVLIGVNSDADRDALKKSIVQHRINWRSFWCGEEGPLSPLAIDWGIRSWPTLFLIDSQGTICAKNLQGKKLEEKISELTRKAMNH